MGHLDGLRKHPFLYRMVMNGSGIIPERIFVPLVFKAAVGYWPNIKNPTTYDEKVQWLKFNWHDPLATQCADKYAVREYVEKKGLGHILNEMYDVYDNADDIDFDALPDQFVLKAAHGSCMNIICDNKAELDIPQARKTLKHWLKMNYYYYGREWVYNEMPRRIVCEKFMVNETGHSLIDYKFFCFNGEPQVILMIRERTEVWKIAMYDTQWNKLNMTIKKNRPLADFERPDSLEEMVEYARILSKDFKHVRVDFYNVNGKPVFGEMTFFPASGFYTFHPEYQDLEMGKLFSELPEKS